MKSYYSFSFLAILFLTSFYYCQSDTKNTEDFQGAWETTFIDEYGNKVQAVMILQDSFIAETFFNKEDKIFYQTLGGSWSIGDDMITMNIHFDSKDSTKVGISKSWKYELNGNQVTFEGSNRVWTKIDNGNTSDLANPWFFSGRKRNGEMSRRPLRARKTMKIISDTRFQWVAYNDETGVFSGTGGGTYTAVDGKYTENIEFFSRNADRVGASLSFDYEIKDGEWHHTGFSSKGDPMHEVWAPIQMIAKE